MQARQQGIIYVSTHKAIEELSLSILYTERKANEYTKITSSFLIYTVTKTKRRGGETTFSWYNFTVENRIITSLMFSTNLGI